MKKWMPIIILAVLLMVPFVGATAQEIGGQEVYERPPKKEDPGYDVEKANRKTRLGFSLGTPGGINLVFVQDFPNTTLTLTGGGGETEDGHLYGFQAGLSVLRSERTRNYQALNIIGGHMHLEGDEWTYGGIEGFFQWRAFFLAPGLTVGSGDFTNPQVSLQFGFVWAL